MEYTVEQLKWIKDEMAKIGVHEYRFLVENNQYVCDKKGNIFSLYMRNQYGFVFRVKKIKLIINANGYYQFGIYKNGKRETITVHRAVTNAWYGQYKNLVVNHINGIRTDNRLENLEICTPLENLNHRSSVLKHGILKKKICIYFLFRYYNFTVNEIQKIFPVNIKDIKKWINELSNAFSDIEFTDIQLKKFFDSILCDDIIDNKEFLKNILE